MSGNKDAIDEEFIKQKEEKQVTVPVAVPVDNKKNTELPTPTTAIPLMETEPDSIQRKETSLFNLSHRKLSISAKIDTATTTIQQARVGVLIGLPFLAMFGVSTVGVAATVGTGGLAAIAIVFVIAVAAKIKKKTDGIGALNNFLKMITLLFTQLLITNAVIIELSTLFKIKLNESLVAEINNKLNDVTKQVLSLAPVVTAKKDTQDKKSFLGNLTRKAKNVASQVYNIKISQIIDNAHKFFNQDRLTAGILKDVNILNGLFIALQFQLNMQINEKQALCIGDIDGKDDIYKDKKTRECIFNHNFTTSELIKGKDKMEKNFTFTKKPEKKSESVDNNKEINNDNAPVKAVPIGTDKDQTLTKNGGNNPPVLTTYRDAYLYWTENSENYKKLKSGNMEELSEKIGEVTQPGLDKNKQLVENATADSVVLINAQNNPDTTNNSASITDPNGNSCIDFNGNGRCDLNEMGGGGTLFFFDDIRKMLQKNRDAINSFLTKLNPNRNARKTRKANRVKKTRNGRKARKHSTIYKRKARKHTNTRRN